MSSRSGEAGDLRTLLYPYTLLYFRVSNDSSATNSVGLTSIIDRGKFINLVVSSDLYIGCVEPCVGSRFFSFWWVGLGPLLYGKFERIILMHKIWLYQTVKFDFTADLTGTGNR